MLGVYDAGNIRSDKFVSDVIPTDNNDLEEYYKTKPNLNLDLARIAIHTIMYLNCAQRETICIDKPDQSRIKQLEERIKATKRSKTRIIDKLQKKLVRLLV